MRKKNFGLPGILSGSTESEEVLMDRARAEVAKKIGVSSLAKPFMQAPTDHGLDEDLYHVPTMKKPVEVRNKFGDTPAMKAKAIQDQLTKPKSKPMNILAYVDRVSNLYDGTPRKFDDKGKPLKAAPAKPVNTNLVKDVKEKWMYKSWFDEQKEYDEQVKKGINKQDEELNRINGVTKADTEKRIATMGDPKSDGVWKKFVDKNK